MRIALFLLLLPLLPACELVYLPPASWLVFPIAEVSDNSMTAPDIDEVTEGNEAALGEVTVGVLKNPNRKNWTSTVEGEVEDERIDENLLLAEFLDDLDLFKSVTAIDSLTGADEDFIITTSVDCMYTIELDGSIFLWNCMTLGIGFLIGWPYQDSSAFYVADAVFYDNRDGNPRLVAGSIAENYKEWYCVNLYWRPGFYDGYALEPLFEQFLYDFLTRSGCLEN